MKCPECHGEITLAAVVAGEVVPCPECGAELEVVATDPPALALAPEIQEDYGE
jgi:alpha-aminoadipate carrier protein LysW